jgi:HlyD family secretion protein
MKAFFARISKRNRIILGLAALIIIVIALVLNARGRAASSSTYQTTTLQRGELVATVGATGSVRARQSADLSWQTTGTVASVNVKVGDKVQKGDVLATLDMSSVPQNIIQAQANLVSAQKALQDASSNAPSAQAAIDLRTAQDAYKKAYTYRVSLSGKQWIEDVRITYVGGQQIPVIRWFKGYPDAETIQKADNDLALKKATLDDAQRNYDRLKNGPNPADVAAAQANVDASQAALNTARIIAPFDGVITQESTLPGDSVGGVQGSASAPVAFRVDDVSNLLVDVQVSEVDINSVAVSQPVTLSFDAVAGKNYQGKVVTVSQSGDLSSGAVNFTVTVQLTDADVDVKPGMTAGVNIIVNQVKDQLLVPNRAVRLVDGQRVVYILTNGRAKPVNITLGASSDTMSVVASGDLKAGDLVILNPPAQVGGPFRAGG